VPDSSLAPNGTRIGEAIRFRPACRWPQCNFNRAVLRPLLSTPVKASRSGLPRGFNRIRCLEALQTELESMSVVAGRWSRPWVAKARTPRQRVPDEVLQAGRHAGSSSPRRTRRYLKQHHERQGANGTW